MATVMKVNYLMKASAVSTKLLITMLVATIVLGVPLALLSTQWTAQAQVPPPPKVGQTLTVTSFEGIARMKPTNGTKAPGSQSQTPGNQPPNVVEKLVSVQLTWKVTKVNSDGSWTFDITGGTVTVGDESYTVNKGRGFVSASGVVHWGLQGTNASGETFAWSCNGLLGTLGGKIINAMNGILREKNEVCNITFLATIQ